MYGQRISGTLLSSCASTYTVLSYIGVVTPCKCTCRHIKLTTVHLCHFYIDIDNDILPHNDKNLQAPRRSDVNSLLQTLHWLPVEQRINYKLAVLTFKTQQMSFPQYLRKYISFAHQRMQHSIVVRPIAVRAISTDIIRRTSDLEVGTHCHLLS